ncbi:tetratricopeptide repeat protein [Salimicrobium salexigens]|uniref:Tetratricopeptide repeat-containing protein n=1 Tax=Salimicrobium salexigens TaxID=908941 RepID=A0ABY1L099_9BACI|nr:tetratricopeptide repeat protein [Salimicrobium salexigens]SIT00881.1 Tetratricopeptide repeat-containing protein [Salimicrobium salexigens]
MPKRTSDDLPEEIREAKGNLEAEKGGYSRLIALYRELRQQLRRENDRDLAADIEKKLIYYLVEYGPYRKTIYRKDEKEAIDALKQALHFEDHLPLAHYRLGLLYLRRGRFTEAGSHFSKAVEVQGRAKRFPLNERQLYYAHLYLITSELHVLYDVHEKMNVLSVPGKYEPFSSSDMDRLYEKLQATESYLSNRAFLKITKENEEFLSKGEAEDALSRKELGTGHLYFGDETIEIGFDGHTEEISRDYGKILYYLLQFSREEPLDAGVMAELAGEEGVVRPTTFRQRVSRLSRKLEELGLTEALTMEHGICTFTAAVPFIIVHRADEQIY